MRALDTWRDTRPHISCLKSHNIEAVGRYYSKNAWKVVSKAEADALSANGITLWVVYQDSNNDYHNFSTQKGRKSAKNAIKYAKNTIKQPEGSAIYFAVDYDASPAHVKGKIRDYFQGVNAVFESRGRPYRIGVYGNGAVCKKLLDWNLVDYAWLNMSTGHHGHAEFYASNRWALRQRTPKSICSVTVDPNELNPAVDFGGFITDAFAGQPALAAVPQGPVNATAGNHAYVRTEGLNFRKKPNGKIIRPLTIGDQVVVLADSNVANWKQVQIGGEDGFVHGNYLRDPAHPLVEELLQNTIAEWVRFDKGRAHEETSPYHTYVGEMWQSIGLNYDGRSRYPNGKEVPWSAAFISYVVRKSGGAYGKFKFDQAHSKFSHDAIQGRILNRTNRPFWGYRIKEKRPEIGDIIHRNRGKGTYTFDYVEDHSKFSSHADIVVEVRGRTARVIGGNVGDTVSMRRVTKSGNDLQEYELDADGYLKGGQRIIALLKNRVHRL